MCEKTTRFIKVCARLFPYLLFAKLYLHGTTDQSFQTLFNLECFFLFYFILTGSIFVSPCRNDSSSPLVHKLFCSVVARPAKAAQIEDAAKVEGGYIRNFSSGKQ